MKSTSLDLSNKLPPLLVECLRRFQALATEAGAPRFERLYEADAEHADLLDDDFDYELASARILGRDLARLTTPTSRAVITEILDAQTDRDGTWSLIFSMVKRNANFAGDAEKAWRMLDSLRQGFNERGGPIG